MKGLFRSNFTQNTLVEVSGEEFHHFKNVLRFKKNDQICLLDGKGYSAIGTIQSLEKNNLTIHYLEIIFQPVKQYKKIILCPPKKEYLKDCIKNFIQLGFSKIYLYQSTYSNKEIYSLDKVIKLAMEQSLNPYYLEIEELNTLPESITIVTNQREGEYVPTEYYLIGPEGGFSPSELKNNSLLSFPTNILTSSNAVTFLTGYLSCKNVLK